MYKIHISGGYCVGGYLAYDITKIFELQGDEVKALIEIYQEPFVYKKYYKRVSYLETVLTGMER